jgi:hypothetical protein
MPEAYGIAREAENVWTSDPHGTGGPLIKRGTLQCFESIRFEPRDDDVRDIAFGDSCIWTIATSGIISSYSPLGVLEKRITGILQYGWGLTYVDGLLWASDDNSNTINWICLYPDEVSILYRGMEIDDSSGNGNGRMDPGEVVESYITITNRGGMVARNVTGLLECNDLYVSVTQGFCSYDSLITGESAVNTQEPFSISADPNTPEGYHVSLNFIVTTDTSIDTFLLETWVGFPSGDFLVWDPDPNHSSGPVVKHFLDSLHYEGEYTTSLDEFFGDLSRFSSIWVCLGQFPAREIVRQNSKVADSLEKYLLTHNGRMYLEGSEVFYYDYLLAGGFNFGPLFGIKGISDGGCDLDTIFGCAGTFSEGMVFHYLGENLWIDRLETNGNSSAFHLFKNSDPQYWCCIACSTDMRRTVGASFEFSGLNGVTVSEVSLVDSIMKFFGISAGSWEKEHPPLSRHVTFLCNPNPLFGEGRIIYSLRRKCQVTIELYDVMGRHLRDIHHTVRKPGTYSENFDVSDLASGIYYIRFNADKMFCTRKIVVLK